MRKITGYLLGILTLAVLFIQCNTPAEKETISYYSVPLKCGAAEGIGCGSRIKPLFLETEKEKNIKESWTNREGTVIAIVWAGQENEKLIQSLFAQNDIEAKLIHDTAEVRKITADFRQPGKWLKGMEVDQLSIEEAGVIARDLTQFAEDAKLINHEESEKIRKEFEEYFKKELVIVRTFDELKSTDTRDKWREEGYAIYEKHLGKQRADSVSVLYAKRQVSEEESCCDEEKKDDCCKKKEMTSLYSEITCPKCGHKKTEKLPTDVCMIKYTCEKCKTDLFPKKGDCCVFCTHGDHKCPSKQEG